MKQQDKVVIFGGTGFVGRAVINELSKQGYDITLAVQRKERHRDLSLFSNINIVTLSKYDLPNFKSILDNQTIAINLLSDQTAETENVPIDDLVETNKILKVAIDQSSISKVILFSQIGANSQQCINKYLEVLSQCENIMNNLVCNVVRLRAGLLIGEGDFTTSLYAKELDKMSLLPIYAPKIMVQPLAVSDFAKSLVKSIKFSGQNKLKFDVSGKNTLSLKALAELIHEIKCRDVIWALPVCSPSLSIWSKIMSYAPSLFASKVQKLILAEDLVSKEDFVTNFGFHPKCIESTIAPYIKLVNVKSRYVKYRKDARRHIQELNY